MRIYKLGGIAREETWRHPNPSAPKGPSEFKKHKPLIKKLIASIKKYDGIKQGHGDSENEKGAKQKAFEKIMSDFEALDTHPLIAQADAEMKEPHFSPTAFWKNRYLKKAFSALHYLKILRVEE